MSLCVLLLVSVAHIPRSKSILFDLDPNSEVGHKDVISYREYGSNPRKLVGNSFCELKSILGP